MNSKIYINTHCDFVAPVKHQVYEILDCRTMGNDSWRGISGKYFSELYNYEYLVEHMQLPDITGFCGYRKYFSFMDDVPDLEALIKNHGCIVGQKLTFRETVRQQYAWNHNIRDLERFENILPCGFQESFSEFLSGHVLYPCNMFILKKEDFIEMMEFVWNTLVKFTDEMNFRTDEDIYRHVYNEYMAGHTRCFGGVKHQGRIAGYLGERLTSAWIMDRFSDAYSAGLVMTQDAVR